MRTLFLFCISVPMFSQIGFPIDSELRRYLNLTTAQLEQLQRNMQEFRQSQSPTATRLSTVNQEIAAETRKPTPNPLELGLRYQEIETICREQDGPRMAAHQKQRQVLTEEQRALLLALSENQRLAPFASMAIGLFFVSPGVPLRVPFGLEIPSISGFSAIPAELAIHLNLTPAQLGRMQNSLLANQRFVAARNSRSNELTAEIDTEFRRDVPSPRELGDRYAELESIRRQIADRETSLRGELVDMLTPQQRGLVDALEKSRSLINVTSSAEQYQLLPPLPGRSVGSAFRSLILFAPEFAMQRQCEGGPDIFNVFNFVDPASGQQGSMRQ
jgi:hypothetical protein